MQRYQPAKNMLVQKMVLDVFVCIVTLLLSILFHTNTLVLVFTLCFSAYCLFRAMIHVYRYCKLRAQENH